MELDYKILIIEDDERTADYYQEILKKYMNEKGLNLDVKYINSVNKFNKSVIDYLSFDFFMVDLKFGNDNAGDTFVKTIKKNLPNADILFYSSDRSFLENFRNKYEGVYFAEKDEEFTTVEDKAISLLEKAIIKIEMPASIRGVILNYMAYFDSKIKGMIHAIVNSLTADTMDECKDDIIKYLYICLKHKIKEYGKSIGTEQLCLPSFSDVEIKRTCFDVNEFVENYKVTDSSKNMYILRKLIDLEHDDSDFFSLYKELSETRNIMAHAKCIIKDDEIIFEKSPKEKISYKSVDIIPIRKKILQFKYLLENLSNKVSQILINTSA